MRQMLHKTIVLRKCLNCEGTIGIGVWPWSGRRFTVSHGLCQGCFGELEAAALASEADTAPRRRRPQDPPAAEGWYNASGI